MRIDWNLTSILSLISAEIPENDLAGLGEMYISLSKSKYCRIELASHKNGGGVMRKVTCDCLSGTLMHGKSLFGLQGNL